MARCGCGGGLCNCSVQAGENVTLSGSGSAANPYVISADVPCSTVRACLSGGSGITYSTATGVIAAHLSGQAVWVVGVESGRPVGWGGGGWVGVFGLVGVGGWWGWFWTLGGGGMPWAL